MAHLLGCMARDTGDELRLALARSRGASATFGSGPGRVLGWRVVRCGAPDAPDGIAGAGAGGAALDRRSHAAARRRQSRQLWSRARGAGLCARAVGLLSS